MPFKTNKKPNDYCTSYNKQEPSSPNPLTIIIYTHFTASSSFIELPFNVIGCSKYRDLIGCAGMSINRYSAVFLNPSQNYISATENYPGASSLANRTTILDRIKKEFRTPPPPPPPSHNHKKKINDEFARKQTA